MHHHMSCARPVKGRQRLFSGPTVRMSAGGSVGDLLEACPSAARGATPRSSFAAHLPHLSACRAEIGSTWPRRPANVAHLTLDATNLAILLGGVSLASVHPRRVRAHKLKRAVEAPGVTTHKTTAAVGAKRVRRAPQRRPPSPLCSEPAAASSKPAAESASLD